MAIIDSLNQLETNIANAKQTLVDNMNAKGVSVTTADTLTDIAKKVSDISQGSGGLEIADGTVFAYSQWTELPEQYKDYIQSCTKLNNMFNNCTKLTSLDLSWLDTSNVTDMNQMFYYCQSLTSLDVSNFDTSNVTDMESMFRNCRGLTSLDLSNFNTSKVKKMTYMFYDCSKLTSLDVSQFDTSKVTEMVQMFSGCNAIKYVFGEIDFASIQSDYYGNIIGYLNINTLRQITLKNLGFQQNFKKTSSLDKLTNWGVNSDEVQGARQSLIDTLITYSFDRAAAGYSTCTITLASNTKAVLTEDEIAQITSKGYTIA